MSTTEESEWRAANPSELGRALALARRSKGFKQEALAVRLGCQRTYLTRMEAGLSTAQIQRTFAFLRELGFELAVVQRGSTHD